MMNLKINIITKKRVTNLDNFFFSYYKVKKNTKTVLMVVDRTRPGYPSRVPRMVPPSGVPLYNP